MKKVYKQPTKREERKRTINLFKKGNKVILFRFLVFIYFNENFSKRLFLPEKA